MANHAFFILQESHHLHFLTLMAFSFALTVIAHSPPVSPPPPSPPPPSPPHSNSTHNQTHYFRPPLPPPPPPHSNSIHNPTPNFRPPPPPSPPPPPHSNSRHNPTHNFRHPPPSPPPPQSNSSHNPTPNFRPPPPPQSNSSHNPTPNFRPPPPPHSNSSHNQTHYFRPQPPPPPPPTPSSAAPPPHSTTNQNSTPYIRGPRPTTWPDRPQFINDVIEALISSGDFSQMGMLLSAAVAATPLLISLALPVPSATLFIPSNAAMAHLPARFDPFLIPYHIIPGPPLSFADLRRLGLRARLPTLLPSNSIVVTNNSVSNFTIDDSQIVRPDLFHNAAVTVHGTKNILDYSIYGAGALLILSPPVNQNLPRMGTLDCIGSASTTTVNGAAIFYLLVLCIVFLLQV